MAAPSGNFESGRKIKSAYWCCGGRHELPDWRRRFADLSFSGAAHVTKILAATASLPKSAIICYTMDDDADEIIILNVKHSAQRREHEDA